VNPLPGQGPSDSGSAERQPLETGTTSRSGASARQERRALQVGIAGNLLGAACGLGMFLHSGSEALLLDGLYTAVMAASGLVALQVSRAAHAPRSRAYPFGASGQEPLYQLFQSLVLLGMVVVAALGAAGKVIAVANGGTAPVLELSGLGWYFTAMVLLNLALGWQYGRRWRLSGGQSDLLLDSSHTALFDAAITAGTGLALLGSPLLQTSPLAAIAPIADSLIVLMLSTLFVPAPLRSLRRAMAESAGVSVEARLQQRCRNALAADLEPEGCRLVELAMIKLGRTYTVVTYVNPADPLSSAAVDQLRQHLDRQMQHLLRSPVLCEVIPTAEHPYGDLTAGAGDRDKQVRQDSEHAR